MPMAVPTERTTGNETNDSAPKPAMLVNSEQTTALKPHRKSPARKIV